jgi:hypothetical protein
VAVFPVQNATGRHLILYSGRGSIVDRAVESFAYGRKGGARPGPRANPLFVQEGLSKGIAMQVVRKGYDLVRPSLVEREYWRISNQSKSVTPFELSLSIPADAFLIVTVTQWNSDDFLTRGQVWAAFEAALVRASDGETLWLKTVPRLRYDLNDATSSPILIIKRQDELLDDIALRLMKSFPRR